MDVTNIDINDPNKPDYVDISEDFTIGNDETTFKDEGLNLFLTRLENLIADADSFVAHNRFKDYFLLSGKYLYWSPTGITYNQEEMNLSNSDQVAVLGDEELKLNLFVPGQMFELNPALGYIIQLTQEKGTIVPTLLENPIFGVNPDSSTNLLTPLYLMNAAEMYMRDDVEIICPYGQMPREQ